MFLEKETDNYNQAQGISQIMFSYSLGASRDTDKNGYGARL
jgi:hypothetical protein